MRRLAQTDAHLAGTGARHGELQRVAEQVDEHQAHQVGVDLAFGQGLQPHLHLLQGRSHRRRQTQLRQRAVDAVAQRMPLAAQRLSGHA